MQPNLDIMQTGNTLSQQTTAVVQQVRVECESTEVQTHPEVVDRFGPLHYNNHSDKSHLKERIKENIQEVHNLFVCKTPVGGRAFCCRESC